MRGGRPAGAHHSSAAAGRYVVALVVVATVGLSILNLSALARLVRMQRISTAVAAAGEDGSWHDMLYKVTVACLSARSPSTRCCLYVRHALFVG